MMTMAIANEFQQPIDVIEQLAPWKRSLLYTQAQAAAEKREAEKKKGRAAARSGAPGADMERLY
jgi:hypothetical protein